MSDKYVIVSKDKKIYFSEVYSDCDTGYCFPVSRRDTLSTVIKKLCNLINQKVTPDKVVSFQFDDDTGSLKITTQTQVFETDSLDIRYALINHTHDVSEINNFTDEVKTAVLPILSYTHTQSIAASTWTITHNLGYKPGGIHVFDSADTQWFGEILHIDDNSLTIDFGIASFGGKAYLS